jgi:hypothetical protein
MASSDTDATSGTVRIPTPIPAEARLKVPASSVSFCTIVGEMKLTQKNPRTTDGMPASTSRIGFSVRRTRGRAYSER